MLKTYDIKVRSNFSNNYYNSFKVDTTRGIVYFHQCDARRNGQVARHMTITVQKNGTAMIEALSAEGGRYERFSRTQCLKLALRLLDEARSEARQVSSVKYVKPSSTDEDMCKLLGVAFLLFTLLPVVCTITLGAEEYLTAVRLCATLTSALLSAYFFVGAYSYKKERESEE